MKKNNNQSPEALDPHTEAEDQGLLEKLDEIAEEQFGISPESSPTPTVEAKPAEALSRHLPHLRSSRTPGETPVEKLQELSKNHLTFYLTGKSPSEDAFSRSGKLIPALIYEYSDLLHARYEYPVFLPDNPGDNWLYPLSDIFNRLVEGIEGEGDEAQLARRYVLKLEFIIKKQVKKQGKARFLQLWDKSVEILRKESHLKNQKREFFTATMASVREQLPGDGYLVSDTPETPLWLFQYGARVYWRKKTEDFAGELQELIYRLEDLIRADQEHNPEAHSPEHLKSAMGKIAAEEVDFEVLSAIVTSSDTQPPLPPRRLQRMKTVLETLRAMSWLYLPAATGDETENDDLFLFSDKQTQSVKTALDIFQEQLDKTLIFFKAVHIARLEVENLYREDKHDPFFASFSLEYLSDAEKDLFPPMILPLKSSQLKAEDKAALMELLASDFPIKIVLQVEDLYTGRNHQRCLDPRNQNCWATAVARMAINLQTAYVLQCAFSNVEALRQAFPESIRYDGPALLAIYTGIPKHYTHLPAYLTAAAAQDSRVFPAFRFHPDAGDDWASRFSVDFTPRAEQAFPVTPLVFLDEQGQETTREETFTPVDFWLCDERFRNHYLAINMEDWHEHLHPVRDFLAAENGSIFPEQVPYILAVYEQGEIVPAIPTHTIISEGKRVRMMWRSLQELGGIDNSYVLRALEAERQRLKEETQAEVQSLEEKHREEMTRAVESLAEDVISNIAAALLSEGAFTGAAGAFPATAPAAPPPPAAPAPETVEPEAPPEAPAEEETEAEAEEEISLDEPYIDTPLCTSCNECINKNSQMFAYDENKQAYIKDPTAGTYRELVEAAEKCPVHIIHPGKPKNPNEPGLEELMKRAAKFN